MSCGCAVLGSILRREQPSKTMTSSEHKDRFDIVSSIDSSVTNGCTRTAVAIQIGKATTVAKKSMQNTGKFDISQTVPGRPTP
mmetsp:Transcript_124411/g.248131  ORF Transcript_124411/g.248131 Transcript_124411/m.248131 type:complete len:83 (+) Transcript_124411:180-428(+)